MKKLLLGLAVCALVSLTGCEKATSKSSTKYVAPPTPTHNGGGSSIGAVPTSHPTPMPVRPTTSHPPTGGTHR